MRLADSFDMSANVISNSFDYPEPAFARRPKLPPRHSIVPAANHQTGPLTLLEREASVA